jgi:hypothetical protein
MHNIQQIVHHFGLLVNVLFGHLIQYVQDKLHFMFMMELIKQLLNVYQIRIVNKWVINYDYHVEN